MSDTINLMISDDGVATIYDDTYDITIHCESEEEQRKVVELLKSIPSAQSEHFKPCKNCVHLGHAYMEPCKNCRRNQMMPDWYTEETE